MDIFQVWHTGSLQVSDCSQMCFLWFPQYSFKDNAYNLLPFYCCVCYSPSFPASPLLTSEVSGSVSGSSRHLGFGPLAQIPFSNNRAIQLVFLQHPLEVFHDHLAPCELFEVSIFSSFNAKKIYRFTLLGTVIGLWWETFSSFGLPSKFIAFLNWCLVNVCDLWFMYHWS